MYVRLFTAILLLGFSLPAAAVEGKWTPEQVLQLGDARLRKLGLQLPAKRLWDPARGKGLLGGAIWLDGCSASFISPEGLLVTNHHCLFSVLQEHSTPQRNLIEQGFLAKSRAEELKGRTERVRVPRRFTDVTKEILAAVPAGADDLQRFKAIEKKGTQLVLECEQQPATRCQIASYDGGLWYTLVETQELTDVRLVWAPPRSVGDYGGEIDNWTWPRHGGDFAIARAYGADGKPFKPEFYFPLSQRGVSEGDFVMVLGYPGRTYRSLIAAEVAERKELFFQTRKDLYAEWIRLMEETTRGNAAGEIAVADGVKGLRNRQKNAAGQLDGFARGKLLEKRQAEEAKTIEWAKQRPQFKDALAAREELERIALENRRSFGRDILLDHLQTGGGGIVVTKLLYLPTFLARLSQQRALPDLEREPEFMDRQLPKLRASVEREQKHLFRPADKAITLSFIRRALALPKDLRIAAIDKAFGRYKDAELPAALDALYDKTRIFDLAERMKMFDESPSQLHARKDPLLELGFELGKDVDARATARDRLEGSISRLRPAWRKAVIAHAGRPVDPDANSTLRVTFARVKGYSPRDGLYALPQTTLAGLLAKDTGQDPFDAPEKLEAAAREGRFGKWIDQKLGQVPIDFLADADTTGGNSGSPTVNARGELVGVNFDRVWENVANDFGYNPDIARNVNADVRYLLWMLDQVDDADALLRELGARKEEARR